MLAECSVPAAAIPKLFNIPPEMLGLFLAKYMRKPLTKECPICFETVQANLDRMPIKMPCCSKIVCCSCLKPNITNVNDHKIITCYFCRRDCVIANNVSHFFM